MHGEFAFGVEVLSGDGKYHVGFWYAFPSRKAF